MARQELRQGGAAVTSNREPASTSRASASSIQRIGMATSTDLSHWERHPANPLIEADQRWYEKLDLTCWYEEACRDPWVVYDAEAAANAWRRVLEHFRKHLKN